jgi:hypothetical protein
MDIKKSELNTLNKALDADEYIKEVIWANENVPNYPQEFISRNMSVENAIRINQYRKLYERKEFYG